MKNIIVLHSQHKKKINSKKDKIKMEAVLYVKHNNVTCKNI